MDIIYLYWKILSYNLNLIGLHEKNILSRRLINKI